MGKLTPTTHTLMPWMPRNELFKKEVILGNTELITTSRLLLLPLFANFKAYFGMSL
jgi:hypothetical protein